MKALKAQIIATIRDNNSSEYNPCDEHAIEELTRIVENKMKLDDYIACSRVGSTYRMNRKERKIMFNFVELSKKLVVENNKPLHVLNKETIAIYDAITKHRDEVIKFGSDVLESYDALGKEEHDNDLSEYNREVQDNIHALSKDNGLNLSAVNDTLNDAVRIVKSEGLSPEEALEESIRRRTLFLQKAKDNPEIVMEIIKKLC